MEKYFSQLLTMVFVTIVFVASALAENIFEDSFDYGDTEVRIDSVSGWNGNSAYAVYDPAVGLENAQLYGEAGGSLWRNWTTARPVTTNIPDFAIDTLNAGDKLWLVMLLEFETGTDEHGVAVTAGGNVNGMGALIATNGRINVYAFVDAAGTQDTGIDVATGTHLLLLRYTKGTTASPTDSAIDLWVNPADASSEAALDAAPQWGVDSVDGQVKWGRDGWSLEAITAHVQRDGHVDEIRLGQDFVEVMKIPPPPRGTVVIVR